MLRLVGRLLWALGILAIIVLAVIFFTKEQPLADDGEITARELEERLEAEKRDNLEELEKFLDGLEKEKKPEGRVGHSGSEGRDLAATRKLKREIRGESIDLEKFLEEEADTFTRDEGILAAGTTDLHQEVMWRIVGDWVYFRVALFPYDEATDELMKRPEEAVYLCFNDPSEKRIVPASASARIPMRSFYQRWEDDEPTGWAFNGKLSLAKIEPSSLDHSRVGWIFSQELHTHLKKLKELRADGGKVDSRRVSKR